jgi:peptidoglycan/xylan/chitin deacetylase (PgdA/CDA1 family)
VKVLAEVADRARPPQRGVVVLIYHRVGARTSVQVDLPTALFAQQVSELASSGRVVTLDAALNVLAGSAPPALDPVVVTFDDGTADFADIAVPILARYRVPAVLYLATDFIEEGRAFPGGGQPLSWGALADALSTGLVTVGSHTHTHALLDRLPATSVADELDRSNGLIAERLGAAPRHFAYPKAVLGSPAAEEVVHARYISAALGGGRANPYGRTDPHRLQRAAVQRADAMRWFTRKAAGGMALEDALRSGINRARYVRARS